MQKYRALLISLAIIGFFSLFLNLSDWTTQKKENIYYSDFLDLINSGNVAKVILKGYELEGQLTDQRSFLTTIPKEKVMIDLLEKKKVQIDVKPPENRPWYIYLLLNWGPFLLLMGVWLFFLTRMSGGGAGKIFSVGKSKARKITPEEINTTFKDVAGIDECKADLEEIVDFLKEPNRFHAIGAKIPKGVLMVGPPGTGKTLLAKALSGEAKVPFFSVSGSDFVEMFVGVGASRVRDLFQEAGKNAPCIIFIDEIDAVARHRGAGHGGGNDEREQTLNQMLVEMDGFDARMGVIVVAATNRLDILDPAILRPGRFDRHIHVNLPDINGREAILKVHASPKKLKLAKDVDLSLIARGTPGFSGAELENLCNEAALYAARTDKTEIDTETFEWARDKVMMGPERKSMIMSKEEKKNTAYHEAGHALVSAYVEESDPIHKITVIPRGSSLGLTSFLPENDQVTINKTLVLSKIIISMGGRAAEDLVFDSCSTGVEGDLKMATNLAYQMICKWGMSKKLGSTSVNYDIGGGGFMPMDFHRQQPVSDRMLNNIDDEVRELMNNSYQRARTILEENIDKLHLVAKSLIEKETITAKEFKQLMLPATGN